ncbi:nitroreductase family protein [Pseudomonas resinovorans]|uniref:Nitroreductase family protein n=1 Tax=Metapseudomonas resinovorans TaxID=53412 RepID=A0ABT4YBL8_METRE|nr:nitroreductase family protein [Pseudomonas resinovorans]MDA8486163.1 nitroreductase family protein [Pseudomonas resinovorans]
MNIIKYMKSIARPMRDLALLFVDSSYDFYRYARYSGMLHRKGRQARDFKIIKIYHALEKSLSFRNRKSSSGWGVASSLVDYLTDSKRHHGSYSYHDRVALKTLSDFYGAGLDKEAGGSTRASLKDFVLQTQEDMAKEGGVIQYSRQLLTDGQLDDPERFFFSRYSVRDFSAEPVSHEILKRALALASKTPSACNRQGWHVYHVDRRDSIDEALSFQNGNRGFGHEVPCLLIITADARAFEASVERNQQLIDGGMYAMSIISALHSLGIGSCCLNWSQGMRGDLLFRRAIKISPHHTVVMMLAVGYPRDSLKVCYSARTSVDEMYTYLND